VNKAFLAGLLLLLLIPLANSAPSNSPIYTYSGSYSGIGIDEHRTEQILNTRFISKLVFHLKTSGCCQLCTSGVAIEIKGTSGLDDGAYTNDAEKWTSATGSMPIGDHDVTIGYDCNYDVELYEPLTLPIAISGEGDGYNKIAVEFPQDATYHFDFGLESGEYVISFEKADGNERLTVREPKSADIKMKKGTYTIYLEPSTTQLTKWTLAISASMTCSGTCPSDQLQKPAPDCSCYVPTCEPPCPTGKLQNPYPDCSCHIASEAPAQPSTSGGEEIAPGTAPNTCTATCTKAYYKQNPYPDCSCEPDLSCNTDAECRERSFGDKCIGKCVYTTQTGGGLPCIGSVLLFSSIFAGALFLSYRKPDE